MTQNRTVSSIASLYVLKALGAFLVVFCHTEQTFLQTTSSALRLAAVPIFFLISGYFLYHPSRERVLNRFPKTIKKLLGLVLGMNLFYLLWLYPNNGLMIKSWQQLCYTLYFGNTLAGHLWFLSAMLEGSLILWLIFRFSLERILYFLPLLLLLNLTYGAYNHLCIDWIGTGKSLSFYGEALPFLSLGYLIHKYEDYLIQFRYWWLLGLIALVTGVVEWYLLRPWGSASPINPFFGSLALAPCLLLWALRHKSFGSNHWGETIGRDYSSDIYYFHIAVSTLCWKVFSLVGLRSLIDSDLEVVIVFIASLILAWGIQQIRGFIKQVKSD